MGSVVTVIRLLVGLAWVGLCTTVVFLVCIPLLPSRRMRIAATNYYGRVVGRGCLYIGGATVSPGARAAMEAAKPALYVSNHASILDIFVGIWLCPVGTCGVGKKEVIWYPFFGQIYWLSGHLRVDRQNARTARAGLQDTAAMVRKHKLGVWMWPEGTRSRNGHLQPLKKGFAHMAIATRLPVVPVVVSGTHKGWQKNSLALKPVNVGIQVLPAIDTTDWSLDTINDHVAEVHAAINAALPEDQKSLTAITYTAERPGVRRRSKLAPGNVKATSESDAMVGGDEASAPTAG